MPAYMATHQRSSSYSSVSMRIKNPTRAGERGDPSGCKKLTVTTKGGLIATKRSSMPIPLAPIKKSSEPAPPLSRSPRFERAMIPLAGPSSAALEKIMVGMTVSVRTRVRKLRAGVVALRGGHLRRRGKLTHRRLRGQLLAGGPLQDCLRRKGRNKEDVCRHLLFLYPGRRHHHFGSISSLQQHSGGSSCNHGQQVGGSAQESFFGGVLVEF
uniref:Uncharacterized protein n=1 Tax=Oryza meridionalis TaxID=40149 RepID=A0A0E0D3T4_9ORYZ